MGRKIIKRCRKCALPETFPGVLFNASGKCNYCIEHELISDRKESIRNGLKKEFIKIIKKSSKKDRRGRKYDCIVAFSGGKDSTYMLYLLKKHFNLRIMSHMLDHGLTSRQALKNVNNITKALNIDHVTTKPPISLIKEIFTYVLTEETPYPKTVLSMMSPLCAACQGMIFGTTMKLAIENNIPLLFIGYTPAQYPIVSFENFLKVNSCVYLSSKIYKDDPLDLIKIARDPIEERIGAKINNYFFKSQYIDNRLKVPKVLFPLHALFNYDEDKIYDIISKLGWIKPKDTDACSTNCLVNSLGIYLFVKKLGYHPYVGQLSALARDGKISYNDVINSENIELNSFAIKYSCDKLKLDKRILQKP